MENQKNVPALRFPEFFGEWEKKKLGEIAEKVNSGKTPFGGENVYVDEGVLFIRSQNVFDNKLSYDNSTFITDEVNSTMKNSVVKPKDILLNITGASLGRSCVVHEGFDTGNVNQHVCIIRLDTNNEPYFFQPIFASEKGQNIFVSLQTGSGREGLNFQSIKGITLPIPSLPEQHKIATFLTAVDDKLNQLKKKKTLLEQYKKGVMQKIFSQEIRFKDDDGKDLPDWEDKKLGEIMIISSGLSNTQNSGNIGYKVTRIETISDGKINIEKVGYIESSKNIEQYRLNPGDILFSNINSVAHIGKTAIVTDETDLFHGMNLLCLRKINHLINPLFIYLLLSIDKYRNYFQSICNQAVNQASINQTELAKTEIILPCHSEQTKIANFLSAIDDKINHTTTQIKKTQQWKKGLLQRMFV